MPTVNKNIDFNFFSRSGRVPPKVRFNVWGSACGLSVDAYNAIGRPEGLRVGIDVHNKVICVSPALKTESYVFKPTAKQIERNTIFITKSRHVIKKLKELGIPKMVTGMLVDGELLFKF